MKAWKSIASIKHLTWLLYVGAQLNSGSFPRKLSWCQMLYSNGTTVAGVLHIVAYIDCLIIEGSVCNQKTRRCC
jgi:hypothetical protein